MQGFCATDAAIRRAQANGTLRVEERFSKRFGDSFWVICDESGTLGTFPNELDAYGRVEDACDQLSPQ